MKAQPRVARLKSVDGMKQERTREELFLEAFGLAHPLVLGGAPRDYQPVLGERRDESGAELACSRQTQGEGGIEHRLDRGADRRVDGDLLGLGGQVGPRISVGVDKVLGEDAVVVGEQGALRDARFLGEEGVAQAALVDPLPESLGGGEAVAEP
ncbi:hypothetical protein PG995_005336 [Apiospora arundinis]